MPDTPDEPAYARPNPKPVLIGGLTSALAIVAYEWIAGLPPHVAITLLAIVVIVTMEILANRDREARIEAALKRFDDATARLDTLHDHYRTRLLGLASHAGTLTDAMSRLLRETK